MEIVTVAMSTRYRFITPDLNIAAQVDYIMIADADISLFLVPSINVTCSKIRANTCS